jgi:uncharacterized protein
MERGLRSTLDDIEPQRGFIVYPGSERYRLSAGVEVTGLADLCAELDGRRGRR